MSTSKCKFLGYTNIYTSGGNDDEQNILSRSILKDFLSIYDISINACEKIVMTGGAGIFT